MRAPHHRYTFDDYLVLEESSTVKHEFFEGEIFAMAGGSPVHAALGARIVSELDTQLRGKGCLAYNSDLRVRVLETGLGTYPDATVVCGDPKYHPERFRKMVWVINPVVLVEVLSDSTEEYDRGAKFDNYQRIETLQEYVLVSHREPIIEVFRRGPNAAWIRSEGRAAARIRLTSIDCELSVDRVYEGINLSAA